MGPEAPRHGVHMLQESMWLCHDEILNVEVLRSQHEPADLTCLFAHMRILLGTNGTHTRWHTRELKSRATSGSLDFGSASAELYEVIDSSKGECCALVATCSKLLVTAV
jgi:hypothetical protein